MGDRIREEEIVLRYIGAGIAHRADGYAVHILPVHKQGTVRHIVGAQQQVHQCGLARAGLAYDAYALAGLHGEGDIPQHIVFAVRIAEIQMPKLDAAARVGQVGHAVPVGYIDRRIEQLGDAVQRCFAAGCFFNQHRDRHDGPDDGLKVADILHQLPGVELPRQTSQPP